MNNNEAKFILQGYRPNGADAGDAAFCAAIEQARQDPALGEWLARQQAFDSAVSAKLAQAPVPPDLRAAILAGGQVTAANTTRRAWWNQPAWMAAAASVAIFLASLVALWPRTAAAFDAFAIADAKQSATHGGHGHEHNTLQAALNDPATKLTGKLPIDFVSLHDSGCRMVQFQGQDVLELCFNRNGVWFHCYMARASDFPHLAMSTLPTLVDRDGISLASWTDGENLIVVVSKTGRKALEAIL